MFLRTRGIICDRRQNEPILLQVPPVVSSCGDAVFIPPLLPQQPHSTSRLVVLSEAAGSAVSAGVAKTDSICEAISQHHCSIGGTSWVCLRALPDVGNSGAACSVLLVPIPAISCLMQEASLHQTHHNTSTSSGTIKICAYLNRGKLSLPLPRPPLHASQLALIRRRGRSGKSMNTKPNAPSRGAK